MAIKDDLEMLMRNRVKTIIDSKGKTINRYESENFTVKDVRLYLEELGYKPISKATIMDVDKYYVYNINNQKYVLKRELEGVSFFLRGY